MSEVIPAATSGEAEANAILAQAKGHEVTDQATADAMTRLIEYCDGKKKSLETARLSLTGPLNKQVKFINGQFKGAKEAYEKASREGRARLKPYLQRLDRERREAEEIERRKLAEAADREAQKQAAIEASKQRVADKAAEQAAERDPHKKGGPPVPGGPIKRDAEPRRSFRSMLDEEPDPPPLPPANPPKPKPKGSTKSAGTRKVRKWRVTDESAIPREFLVLDEAKVNRFHKAGDQIPGVEYYEDDEVVMR